MSTPTAGKEDVSNRLSELTNLLKASKASCEEAKRVQEEREHDKTSRREEKDKQWAQLRSQVLQLKSACEENKETSSIATTKSSEGK